jgi:hypothetical protein
VIFRLVVALLIMVVTWRSGMWMLRTFGTVPPGPPPQGEMRRIKVQYRCSLCGAEARMTRAATEFPDPPRHCMEDMEFVPSEDD